MQNEQRFHVPKPDRTVVLIGALDRICFMKNKCTVMKQGISIKGQQIEGLLWKVLMLAERAIQLSGVVHIPVHPHTLHQPAVTDTCAAHPNWQASARSGPAQRPWSALPNAQSHTATRRSAVS